MKRKLLHIGMVGFAFFVGQLSHPWIVLLCLCAFLFNLLLLPGLTNRAFERPADIHRGYSLGMLLYPLILFVLAVSYPSRSGLFVLAWGILAFGDGFSAIIGKLYPLKSLSWNKEKSWGGLLAFWFFGSLGSLALLAVIRHNWQAAIPLPELLQLNSGQLLLTIMVSCLLAGLFESFPKWIDDNLSVPLSAFFSAWIVAHFLSGGIAESFKFDLAYGAILVLGILAFAFKKLDWTGSFLGVLIASLLYFFGGTAALIALFLFFFLGVGSSSLFKNGVKADEEIRDWKNVAANAAPAAVFLLGDFEPSLKLLLCFACFSAASADTVSSELGRRWGKNTIDVISRKAVNPGENGGISLEGTIGACMAALLVALSFYSMTLDSSGAAIILIAGIIGMLIDSILGSLFENSGEMNNHSVNFTSGIAAGCIAFLLHLMSF